MNLLKGEMDNDFRAIKFRSQRRHVRTLPQVQKSKTNIDIDASRKALLPGKRISKTGKVYWETRANRSDAKSSRI